MNSDTQMRRRERLADLLSEHFSGDKTALGRALGFRDGSYLGQMLRGEKPVGERLIERLHDMMAPDGSPLRGWFAEFAEPVKPVRTPSESEWALLDLVRVMPPEVRDPWTDDGRQKVLNAVDAATIALRALGIERRSAQITPAPARRKTDAAR